MKHLFIKTALFSCTFFFSQVAAAQVPLPPGQVNTSRLAEDIMVMSGNADDLYMSLWLPSAHMKATAAQMKDVNPEVVKIMSGILEDYALFCVTNHKVVNVGGQPRIESMSEYDMRKSLVLEYNGKTYTPIDNTALSEDAVMVKKMLEPMMKSMMGSLGDGMVIMYFKVQDEKGNNALDPYHKGEFSLKLGNVKLTYNMQLSALFADKLCPVDNDQFPSDYKFCPYHGKELKEQEAGNIMPPPAE